MAFTYTTEYCLGRRGRINRSYTGIQAMIAIGFDLALGFSFAIIGLGVWLVRASVVTLSRFIATVMRLPFRVGLSLFQSCVVSSYQLGVVLFHAPFRIVRTLFPRRVHRGAAKPAWATFEEL
jgi:hypothetical protein